MSSERAPGATGRRAVLALVLTALVAFAAVGATAFVVAHRIARADALSDALRTAHGVGSAVFGPELGPLIAGSPSAAAAVDAAVAVRRADGSLVRATLWDRDGAAGRVVWSDDRALVHQLLPISAAVGAVFDRGRDYAELSSLTEPDDRDEQGAFHHLVEAYVPLTVPSGRTLALELDSSDAQVRQADHELSERMVPFTLLALLVLALAQLPVSIWLVRRIAAAQQDRARMLDTVLVSSERERWLLARHLHDGVVQELAGAALVLEARTRADPAPPRTRHAMRVVTQTLHRAVGDLRDMLVELHPRELTGDSLGDLVESAALRACPDQLVTVTTRLDRPLPPEVAAFLYRCARECAVNVAKHAQASRVGITITSAAEGVELQVRDDGVGIADTALDRTDGHLGLALLREAAADLGGALTARGDDEGTLITITLPPG